MTQTEFVSIKEATAALKGSIKAIVINESDLKSGTTNGKDWTKRSFTIEDSSGRIEMTIWNEDVKKFKVGYTYEIVNPWWKQYEGKPQLDLGKYAQVTIVASEKAPAEHSPIPPEEPTEPVKFSIKGAVSGFSSHENCWAVAVEQAKLTYPSENNMTSRMILAQVFYKKLMDFEIHRGKK